MGVVTTLPRGRRLTRADLDALPDDGWRHELVDGTLVMTPAPSPRHQTIVLELAMLLRNACPAELQVLVAPVDVVLAPDTVLQPDVIVARRSDLTERDLPAAPLLAVEVLSPSTRRVDLVLKAELYAVAGCPSYWTIDPGDADTPPSVIVRELRDGTYVEVGRASGSDILEIAVPFAVRLEPASLA
jgi:Uma2 family endonuclease